MAFAQLKASPSQNEICDEVSHLLLLENSFVFLSGQSGSGRTSILEQILSRLEGRFLTVFIPCSSEMLPDQLRELFLQQLFPTQEFDLSLNLADSVAKARGISVKKKILLVVDDIDKAVDSFYREIFTLFEQNLGQNRLSVLMTAKPIYVENKIASSASSKVNISEVLVKPLSLNEALALSQALFTIKNLDNTFAVLAPKLPRALERCKGNLGAIIKLTEDLMENPGQINNSNFENKGNDLKPKQRRNGATLFVTILCIVIVLACLIPLFLGSSFLDKIFGSKDSVSTKAQENAPKITVSSDDGVTHSFNKDEVKLNLDNEKPTLTIEENKDNKESKEESSSIDDKNLNIDPLHPVEVKEVDIKASENHGSENEPMVDEGGLLPQVSEGLEVKSPESQTRNSVTLRGDTLEEIENSESDSNESDRPRQDVDRPLENSKPAFIENKKDEIVSYLGRADNSLKAKEIKLQEEQEQEAKKALALKEQKELLEVQRLKKEQELKEKLENNTTVLNSKATVVENAVETKQNSVKQRRNLGQYEIVLDGKGIPGAQAELLEKNPNHYTVQIISGHNRQAVVDKSAPLDGRYWIYETRRFGKSWYVLCVGDYLSINEAQRAVNRLPRQVRQAGAFPKSFGTIQKEIGVR